MEGLSIILYGYRNMDIRYWTKDIKSRFKDILMELCEWVGIVFLEGAIDSDHVHLYVSVPPKQSPSRVMKILKNKSAEYMRRDFPELNKKYWGLHIWARGYFVSTVGIDTEVISKYAKELKHYDFQISTSTKPFGDQL